MKTPLQTQRFVKLLLAGAVTSALAACGGGGGSADEPGTPGTFGADENLDGITDVTLDSDLDSDGQDDVDVDGDGVADFDVNQDGIRDTNVDNDAAGSVDPSVLDELGLLAGFDTDGDGVADLDTDGNVIETGPNFTPVSAQNPCGSASGTDNASSNDDWADNCTISRVSQHANSTYTAGIQRVVFCSTFAGNSTATSVDGFTDGDFGANTQAAIEAFQQANSLTADGIVGPQTWAVMREALTDEALEVEDGGATAFYGVDGDVCDASRLFIAQNSGTVAGNDIAIDGWQLTQGEQNSQPVVFGVQSAPVD